MRLPIPPYLHLSPIPLIPLVNALVPKEQEVLCSSAPRGLPHSRPEGFISYSEGFNSCSEGTRGIRGTREVLVSRFAPIGTKRVAQQLPRAPMSIDKREKLLFLRNKDKTKKKYKLYSQGNNILKRCFRLFSPCFVSSCVS